MSAVTGAMLYSLALPPFEFVWAVWLAFAALGAVTYSSTHRVSTIAMVVAGALFAGLSFRWLGRFHWLGIPSAMVASGVLFFGLPTLLSRVLAPQTLVGRAAIFASTWTIVEVARSRWILFFPFGSVYTTQYRVPAIVRTSSFLGSYSITWMIVFTGSFIGLVALCLLRKQRVRKLDAAFPVLLVVCVAVLSASMQRSGVLPRDVARSVNVAVAQTVLRPNIFWSEQREEVANIIAQSLNSSSDRGADVVVFSETILNVAVALDSNRDDDTTIEMLNSISGLSQQYHVSTIVGALYAPIGEARRLYNVALQFDHTGSLTGLYRKRELVPFGEYWPLGRMFPRFRQRLVSQHGAIELSRGPEDQALMSFSTADGVLDAGILICFESTSASLAEKHVRDGASILFVITNDNWSGSRIAAMQHAAFVPFRAAELAVPIVRVANGGPSLVVDAGGAIRAEIPYGEAETGVYQIEPRTPNAGPTVFAILGEYGVLVWILHVFVLLIRFVRSRFRVAGIAKAGPLSNRD